LCHLEQERKNDRVKYKAIKKCFERAIYFDTIRGISFTQAHGLSAVLFNRELFTRAGVSGASVKISTQECRRPKEWRANAWFRMSVSEHKSSKSPRVFISYSHDSTQHKELVLRFAQRLRRDGIDAQIDQYVAGRPQGGWPRWMLDKLDWADFVLLICTETYYRRFRGHEEPGTGKGVDWEGQLITLEMYHAERRTTEFVPVIFRSQDKEFIPEPLSDQFHLLDPKSTTRSFVISWLGKRVCRFQNLDLQKR
jgi:hypothetical protein